MEEFQGLEALFDDAGDVLAAVIAGGAGGSEPIATTGDHSTTAPTEVS